MATKQRERPKGTIILRWQGKRLPFRVIEYHSSDAAAKKIARELRKQNDKLIVKVNPWP